MSGGFSPAFRRGSHGKTASKPEEGQPRRPTRQQQSPEDEAEAHPHLMPTGSFTPGSALAVAARDYIIAPNEYDLGRVIADIHEIRRWNQQRFEMEQLTAIVHEDQTRGLCVGYKDLTPDEFWARGHFPQMPLMPGVLMCEAAAQLSSYFTQKHNLLDAKVIGFGGLEEVRFREPVVPGDRLVIAVERVRVRPRAMIVCRFQGLVRESIVVDGIIKGVPLPEDLFSSAGQTAAGGVAAS
jgi:3-hydroxyacyl-[acyl-carrier-protein] dehydratase